MGVIGIDHRHIYGMISSLEEVGCSLVGWTTEGEPPTLPGFAKRFSDSVRMDHPDQLLNDPDIDLILTAAVPADRAGIAIRAMEAGKDVLADKPGCLSFDDLNRLKTVQSETGRIWSVDFSERFEVPCVTAAAELVAQGAIGQVVQTLGLGPHRLNAPTRPDWFWQRNRNGGILADIGSHQIDQFLFFTGKTDATVTQASVQCTRDGTFQDFGQMTLKAEECHGYVRLDWFTPDALPNWGDGRLFILGTEGTIELRKYVDFERPGTDHLCLVNGERFEVMDAGHAGRPFFAALAHDIRHRTETAMPQAHPFTVTRLALEAQTLAEAAC
jgi:predicted dehydrogenase